MPMPAAMITLVTPNWPCVTASTEFSSIDPSHTADALRTPKRNSTASAKSDAGNTGLA